MKKLFFLCTLILVVVLGACASDSSDAPQDSDTDLDKAQEAVDLSPVRFGIMASIDAIPIVIAQERGLFEAAGLDVELEFFANARDRDAAFQTGNLDGVMTDLVAVGMFQEGGFNVRATGVTTGRFTLVTSSEVGGLEDIAGKTIATLQNGAPTLILDQMLASVGLTLDDVVLEEVPAVPNRLELLLNRQVDAALIVDPFSTIGVADGLHALIHNTDIDFTPIVTAFTEEFIETHPEALVAFYQAFDDAVDFLNESDNYEEYIDTVIDVIGFPEELRDNVDLPEFRHNHLPSEDTLALAIDWLRERDLITRDFEPSDFISDVAFR